MKIHNLIQGSPEWLAYRAQHFNASDAPAMMGVSPYKTRAELLRELHTGVAVHVDSGTQKRFDNGHRAEALARPLAEEFVGAEFFPSTGSEGRLSASFDGITLDDTTVFEHKALNNELRRVLVDEDSGPKLPIYHRIQMEQQLLVSGAERVLFMASQWASDSEDLVEERHCFYYPDLTLRQQIVDGWAQFEKDLATFQMPAAAAPVPAGKAPEVLPALRVEVTGQVTASNLVEFKKVALTAIRSVNRELKTDQDFADAAKAVKWCEDVEERLESTKQHALSQTVSIDALFRTMDEISAEARAVRLELGKLVTRRKTEVKEEAVMSARAALLEHYRTLNAELAPAMLQLPIVDFPGAIKGLRSFDSMQDALTTLLAKSKIEADGAARSVRANFTIFGEQDANLNFLFPDLHQLVHKSAEDFRATLGSRIATHKQAETARLEADRERIRTEELARIEREQRAAADLKAREEAAVQTRADAEAKAESQRTAAAELAAAKQSDGVELSPAAQALNEAEGAARFASAHKGVAQAFAAPAPEVRTFHPAAAALRNEQPTLTLGQIGTRLGFSPSAEFLATLGFEAHRDRSSRLYRPSQFPAICQAISAHVLLAAQEQRAAA